MAIQMNLRPSRVLKKLRAGQAAYSLKTNFCDARLVELVSMFGVLDAVWVDMEHVPNSIAAVEQQVRTAKLYDTDTIVRVPRGSYSDLIKPLEMDAAGIMVPHIMGAEDARRLVQQVRFHPVGRRPLDGGNADGAYCRIPVAEYIKQANSQRFVIVQIEDPEPVDELEAIGEIEGIDMLFFGPGDFSHSIGAPGDMNHPEVKRVRRLIPEVARRCGKFAGTVLSGGTRQELLDMGYQFLNLCSDVGIIGNYLNDLAEELDH